MTARQKLEVLGGVLVAGGFAVIHIALGAVILGVLIVVWANFGDFASAEAKREEPNDAGTEQPG